jgi:hypothetical protein
MPLPSIYDEKNHNMLINKAALSERSHPARRGNSPFFLTG